VALWEVINCKLNFKNTFTGKQICNILIAAGCYMFVLNKQMKQLEGKKSMKRFYIQKTNNFSKKKKNSKHQTNMVKFLREFVSTPQKKFFLTLLNYNAAKNVLSLHS